MRYISTLRDQVYLVSGLAVIAHLRKGKPEYVSAQQLVSEGNVLEGFLEAVTFSRSAIRTGQVAVELLYYAAMNLTLISTS